ncbi:MAG: O-antigen ligase family protein, partial [Patescibacteria group bacterium]|nr:O-antigen ligase family protein [Patescibacteria group bacterium]
MTNLITYFSLAGLAVFSAIKKYWLIVALFCVLPFYAFLITFSAHIFNLDFSQLELIRLFKELIMFGVFAGLIYQWIKNRKNSNLKFEFQISDFFIVLYLIIILGSIFVHGSSLREALFGIRYDFFFLFYYFIFRLFFLFYKDKSDSLIKIIFWTSLPVFVFAILQFFVLPHNFLEQFGYAKEALSQFDIKGAIPAFQLLGNSNLVRVHSFFSGPNQLAAYSLVIIFLALAKVLGKKRDILAYFVATLGIITLILTFSRSAILGFIIGILILSFINIRRRPIFGGIVLGSILAILLLGGLLFREQLYEIVVRPSSSGWHLAYFQDGYKLFLENPFGIGLSKVGPASQWTNQAMVSESFYLQIALEVGFFGLIIFLSFMILLIWELARHKTQIAYTTICTIIAILIASLFLHTLADGILAIYVGFV